MSLVLLGHTACPLCEQPIEAEQLFIVFPAFVFMRPDPLEVFNDAAVHLSCSSADPRRQLVQEVAERAMRASMPTERVCDVCRETIANPHDHIMIPRIGSDWGRDAARHFFKHLHLSCVSHWEGLGLLLDVLRRRPCGSDGQIAQLEETLEKWGRGCV